MRCASAAAGRTTALGEGERHDLLRWRRAYHPAKRNAPAARRGGNQILPMPQVPRDEAVVVSAEASLRRLLLAYEEA